MVVLLFIHLLVARISQASLCSMTAIKTELVQDVISLQTVHILVRCTKCGYQCLVFYSTKASRYFIYDIGVI